MTPWDKHKLSNVIDDDLSDWIRSCTEFIMTTHCSPYWYFSRDDSLYFEQLIAHVCYYSTSSKQLLTVAKEFKKLCTLLTVSDRFDFKERQIHKNCVRRMFDHNMKIYIKFKRQSETIRRLVFRKYNNMTAVLPKELCDDIEKYCDFQKPKIRRSGSFREEESRKFDKLIRQDDLRNETKKREKLARRRNTKKR